MYSGEGFDISRRRAISYMELIHNSQQYKDAVTEFKEKH